MLLEYGARNFFSFKEGVTVSFRLDSNCPEHISLGKDFTPVLGVKGANASGKTHLLKALSFIGRFTTDSFSDNPESPIAVEPFFRNLDPIDFYVEFGIGDIEYRYELSLTDQEILRETIYRTKAKKTKILERVKNELKKPARELARLTQIKLRRNASIISTAHQYEFDELSEIYNFFKWVTSNVFYSGMREAQVDIEVISRFLHENPAALEFITSFIRSCDVGITDIQIFEDENSEGKKTYLPVFLHKAGSEVHPVFASGESSGTKALFRRLPHYQMTLETGGVLVLDEFDTNLHPHILPMLLELFLNEGTNPNNAQIIFSTHDSEILNFLGRYRTYLVNKEENESYAYRLDELQGDLLRNDRPILPPYNEGRLGGVPKLKSKETKSSKIVKEGRTK